MFAKDKVSQSMIDAVKNIVEAPETVEENEKVKTSTGMKVYGSSYGNSERARREQLKRPVDDTKGPNKKELASMAKVKEEDSNFGLKDKLIEALKGKQTKLDKNHNNKLDSQDFAILRGQKNEETELDEAKKIDDASKALLIRAHAYATGKVHKKVMNGGYKDKGEMAIHHAQELHHALTTLGRGDKLKEEVEELDEKEGYSAKAARAGKDIGKPGKNFSKIAASAGKKYGSAEAGKRVAGAILAKLRKEEAEADWTDEQIDALLEYYELEEKHMTDAEKSEQERIVKGMKKGFAGFRKRYGERAKSVMYATATKQAMKEDTVEEEIDPKVRTKDTITGRKPTDQDNDVGRGSDFKSTKVKFRGGPMKEEVKKSDVPAYLRKARGDKPLTVADAKSGSKDSISSKENLAKARGVTEGKRPETDNVPFEAPYTTNKPDVVTDKSGAKHTPMSRARDLARSAMKKIKTEMLGKAPGNNG